MFFQFSFSLILVCVFRYIVGRGLIEVVAFGNLQDDVHEYNVTHINGQYSQTVLIIVTLRSANKRIHIIM